MIWGRGKDKTPSAPKGEKPAQPPEATNVDAGGAAQIPRAEMPVAPAGADAEHADKRDSFLAMAERAQRAQFAQLFAQAVAVLMRDKVYRNMPLRDLEFLVVPAITAGQCAVAHAKTSKDGPTIPVALALWANVSPEVDKAMGKDLDKPLALKPNQWKSGEHTWLITLAGEPNVVGGFLKQIMEREFKGKKVKMRAIDKDGKREVKTLAT